MDEFIENILKYYGRILFQYKRVRFKLHDVLFRDLLERILEIIRFSSSHSAIVSVIKNRDACRLEGRVSREVALNIIMISLGSIDSACAKPDFVYGLMSSTSVPSRIKSPSYLPEAST